MIKLIASDLDGTLIGHDFRFRPRTLRALEAARAAAAGSAFIRKYIPEAILKIYCGQ